ncbi:MAG: hypothetical protein NC112_09085, partial [Oxalobacter formigenes]|nr:hypothetical protein [Oxalobacter formigenes]
MAIEKPKLLTVPFAAQGAKNQIPVEAPTTPGKTNFASWLLGFPPVTMMPIEAGGIPPEGMDMNGVLNAISSHIVFQNAGGQYQFDAEFAQAIGGYPKGVVLISDDIKSAYISLVDNNTENFNTASPIQNWAPYAGEGAGLPSGGQPGQILTQGESGAAGWTNQGNYADTILLADSVTLTAADCGKAFLLGA